MDSGNTLLGPEYLEWLTVLRMNKDFMDFMRFHYPDDAGQEFKMTVARAPPGPDCGGGARLRDPNTLGRHRATLGGRARPWTFGTRRGRLLRPPPWGSRRPKVHEQIMNFVRVWPLFVH